MPEAYPGPLGVSILQRAREKGIWSLETVNLREFGVGKHRNVDETPAGGGAVCRAAGIAVNEPVDWSTLELQAVATGGSGSTLQRHPVTPVYSRRR